jgi:hypothetical protein
LTEHHEKLPAIEDEYAYTVVPAALETFRNLMLREGITTAWDTKSITFTSDKLLNMRRLKERGIIKSYTISKLSRKGETVEEG